MVKTKNFIKRAKQIRKVKKLFFLKKKKKTYFS